MTEPARNSSVAGRIFSAFSASQGSNFRRNFVHVARANVIAQAVALLSAPLLSRLYSAEDFGRLAVFAAVVAIGVSVSTGRFDWCIPNARTAASAATLLLIGSLVLVGTSTVAVLVVTLASIADSTNLIRSDLGLAVFLFPLAMVGLGLAELFNGWFVRQGNLRAISHAKIAQGISNAGVAIVSGLGKLGASGLIGAFLISSWLSIAVLASGTASLWQRLPRTSMLRIATTFKRYRREAGFSTAVSLVNALSSSVNIFMIASLFTLKEAGWYALMLRLAIAPIGLISTAIGQSFWSAAAELARNGRWQDLRTLYLKTTRRLAWLVAPIAVGCGLGPVLVGPLFGTDEWAPAGYVLLAMAPHLIGTAIFSPTNHLVVYRRQAYQLASDILAIALTVLSIYSAAALDLGIAVCTLLVSLSILGSYVLRFFLHLRANSERLNA